MPATPVPPLLLCLDLEAGSEQLVKYAARLARRCDQPVRVLYVSNETLDEGKRATLASRIQDLIGGQLTDLSPQDIHIKEGIAEERIVEMAQACQADPILLGRRRRATLERIYVGSTTSAVISLATLPVLVVPVNDTTA